MKTHISVRRDLDFPNVERTIDLRPHFPTVVDNQIKEKRIPCTRVDEDIYDSSCVHLLWSDSPDTLKPISGTVDEDVHFAFPTERDFEAEWGELVSDDDREIFPATLTVVNPVLTNEKNRKEYIAKQKQARQDSKKWKYAILDILLSLFKYLVLSLAESCQRAESRLRAMKRWGFDDEVKYTEKQLYFCALSIPNTCTDVRSLGLLMPFLPERQRYRVLKMKHDSLANYERIFNKRR